MLKVIYALNGKFWTSCKMFRFLKELQMMFLVLCDVKMMFMAHLTMKWHAMHYKGFIAKIISFLEV